MDHKEKSFLVRRMSHGWDCRYVEFNHDRIFVKFSDPTSELVFRSDFVYKEAEEKGRINNLLTQEESMSILREEGKWSDAHDLKEQQLSQNIKQLRESLNKLKFQKIQQRKNKIALKEAEDALEDLTKIKYQLATSTIEHFAETTRKRWIVRNITEVFHPDAKELIQNERFLDKCIYAYYIESIPEMSRIREVARSEPWRMFWVVSKNNSTPIFSSTATEMTDLQYLLTMWSRIYDFAFESEKKPSDEVIDDDTKFDAWYESEVKRIEEEQQKAQAGGNYTKGQEVFIPADREGARDVYNMNTAHNRSKIKNKQSHIKKEGPTTEANLPDVKKELIMQANRQNSEAVMKRSKGT